MKVRSSLLALGATVLIAATGAGCSSSSSTGATTQSAAATAGAEATVLGSAADVPTSANPGTASGASAAATAEPSAAVAGPAAAGNASCKQLTIAEVQPLVDDKITSVSVSAAAPGGQLCTFKGADASLYVTVVAGDLAAQMYASDAQSMDPATVVPGVGSKAIRGEGPDVSSIDGSVYCSVRPADAGDVPGVGALMHAAGDSANISPVAYQVSAVALGTLCNRIYGTGNTTPDLSGIPKVSAAPTS